MAVTRQDYADWKAHSVTQHLMDSIHAQMEDRIAKLVKRIEPNPFFDSIDRAYIAAATDFLEFEPEFVDPIQLRDVGDAED